MKKFAVVVGVGPGIGRSVALRFARESFGVGLISRTMENLEPVRKEIDQLGQKCLAVQCDVVNERDVQQAFEKIRKELGHPEVLVYNAAARRFKLNNILEVSSAEFEQFWKINCLGAFFCMREVLPEMEKIKRGTILLTGATGSMRSLGGMSSFSVGKFGLRALGQSAAREFGKKGIHVAHIIIDGPVDKPMIRQFVEKAKGAATSDEAFLNPDEIATQFWNLHCQHPSTWTLELDLRPSIEPIYSSL